MTIKEFYKVFLESGKVCTDSRKVKEGNIFFALKGDNFNGNNYAPEALEKGCRMAVVDEDVDPGNERIIRVGNVLEFLQDLAHYHRKQFDIPLIGITGTNGKTTTKELINAVLSSGLNCVATKGNLNNHIGVPLSLLEINSMTEIAVIEMGANHAGEISGLCKIAEPNFGLITNIGKAHLEGFGSPGMVLKAKKELYDHIKETNGTIFINSDDRTLEEISDGMNKISYGFNGSPDIIGTYTGDIFASLQWSEDRKSWNTANTSLIGKYNASNILAAVTIGRHFGISPGSVITALSEYRPGLNRSQYLETGHNSLILDAYNANPDSMKAALDNFTGMSCESKIVILGDMFELGDYSKDAHQEVADMLKYNGLQGIYLVGEEFSGIKADPHIRIYKNIDFLIGELKANKPSGSLILLKGSRGMQMEKLVGYL